MSRCTTRPLNEVPGTPLTGLRNSGWCVSRRSACQARAQAGSYICSSTETTWARVGVLDSLVTPGTIVATMPPDDANVNCSLCLDYVQLLRLLRATKCGPGRVRTDDSRGVSAVLYQLSYRPRPHYRSASASRYADSGRASPGPLTTLHRSTPPASTRNVPRIAAPIVSLNTP